MTSHWGMRVALASLEADALAAAPLQAWGLVLPHGDHVSYQIRHRAATTVNLLPVAHLPAALRPPIDSLRVAAVDTDGGPIGETLAQMGVTTIAALPIPAACGLLWAGAAGPEHFSDAHVSALTSLARQLVERSRVAES